MFKAYFREGFLVSTLLEKQEMNAVHVYCISEEYLTFRAATIAILLNAS